MKKLITTFMLILTLTFAFVVTMTFNEVDAQTYDFNPEKRKLDIGLKLREEESNPLFYEKSLEKIAETASNIDFNAGTTLTIADNEEYFTFNGGSKYYLDLEGNFIKFTLRSVGENVEVWVANNLGYGYDRPADIVTQAQVDMLRDEFENNIYPTDTAFFGHEDYHDGTNSVLEDWGFVPEGYYADNGKNIILVDNIKDESYYANVNVYTAGYYWGALEYYYDRNVVTIDSYAWFALMPNDNPDWAEYQYSIFGTLAHEYQHLIHADNDLGEDTWLNEGMSDFAQYLCGYGHDWTHVNYFLKYPENSLVIWNDYYSDEVLADYGQAYLLQLYLYDHFGKEFIQALAKDTDHGIYSLNKMLNEFDTGIDFQELFRRFSIAVLVDSNNPGNGIYNFDSIDIKVDVQSAQANNKEGLPAWGGNYEIIDATKKIWTINFSGGDFVDWVVEDNPFIPGEKMFSIGRIDNNLDRYHIFEVDLTEVSSATLQFDQFANIELDYDYGYVEISLDGGESWETLAAYTGLFYTISEINLTPYTGNNVLIGFRYVSDIYVTGESTEYPKGWFIDNITIPEINYFNDCSSTDGFVDMRNLLNQNHDYYQAVFVNERVLPNGKTVYKIVSVNPFDINDEDALQLRQLFKQGNNYMITWHVADYLETDSIPFEYDIVFKK
ncbi:hypothetical protein KHQ81_05310 [Mycoplasmatota bacterium]|nr:hypothetical protein KHQ81_05310 [Mycoplasmatota bacterium]